MTKKINRTTFFRFEKSLAKTAFTSTNNLISTRSKIQFSKEGAGLNQKRILTTLRIVDIAHVAVGCRQATQDTAERIESKKERHFLKRMVRKSQMESLIPSNHLIVSEAQYDSEVVLVVRRALNSNQSLQSNKRTSNNSRLYKIACKKCVKSEINSQKCLKLITIGGYDSFRQPPNQKKE